MYEPFLLCGTYNYAMFWTVLDMCALYGPEPSTDGGHIDFLRESKAQGTYLLVGLYSDDVSFSIHTRTQMPKLGCIEPGHKYWC